MISFLVAAVYLLIGVGCHSAWKALGKACDSNLDVYIFVLFWPLVLLAQGVHTVVKGN